MIQFYMTFNAEFEFGITFSNNWTMYIFFACFVRFAVSILDAEMIYDKVQFDGECKFYVDSKVTIILKLCTFHDCYSLSKELDHVAIIFLQSEAHVSVLSCAFSDCHSPDSGSCLRTWCPGGSPIPTVFLNRSTFKNCSGIPYGGACCINEGEVGIELCTFDLCSSSGSGDSGGGAIYVTNHRSYVSITNCTFTRCFADTEGGGEEAIGGGAVSALHGDVTVIASLFRDCSTLRYGGAFCFVGNNDYSAPIAVIQDTEIVNCSAGLKGGGVFFWRSQWPLELFSVTFTNCSSGVGGSGQAVHIAGAGSFAWSGLCIVGDGLPLYTEDTDNVPTSDDLVDGCPWTKEQRRKEMCLFAGIFGGVVVIALCIACCIRGCKKEDIEYSISIKR